MDMLDLEKFKKQLKNERDRILLEHRVMGANTSEGVELSDYDNHPADTASDTYERTKDFALDENYREILERIDVALRKVQNGTYGKCDRCHEPIKTQRLKAIPYATLCVRCQEILERR